MTTRAPASGIPFGDPRHPWRANSEHARKAGAKGKARSPWTRGPMAATRNAADVRASLEMAVRRPSSKSKASTDVGNVQQRAADSAVNNSVEYTMYQLGQKCKDKITGFEGVAIGHVRYISGCNQVLLAPSIAKDGSKREAEWFDEQRLAPTSNKVIVLDNSRTPGFDKPAPKI